MAIFIACPVFIHAALDKNSIYIQNICGMNNIAFQVGYDIFFILFTSSNLE